MISQATVTSPGNRCQAELQNTSLEDTPKRPTRARTRAQITAPLYKYAEVLSQPRSSDSRPASNGIHIRLDLIKHCNQPIYTHIYFRQQDHQLGKCQQKRQANECAHCGRGTPFRQTNPYNTNDLGIAMVQRRTPRKLPPREVTDCTHKTLTTKPQTCAPNSQNKPTSVLPKSHSHRCHRRQVVQTTPTPGPRECN